MVPGVLRNRYIGLLSLVLLCVIVGTAYLAWAVRRALVSSHTAVFGRVATEWVTQYIEEHDGDWPRSWDALLDCQSPPVFSGHDPVHAIETLKSVVAVDFQADPRKLATQTAEDFDAIRSIDGYDIDHREYWGVSTLIETLKEHHGDCMAHPPARPTSKVR